jgi:phosphoenolpyruvate carboxykinase (ATP)
MSHAEKALAGTGVTGAEIIHANLLPPALIAHALRRNEGRLSADGAFIAETEIGRAHV